VTGAAAVPGYAPFERVVDAAGVVHRGGLNLTAAAVAESAAFLACHRHPGCFTSKALEALLGEVGREECPGRPTRRPEVVRHVTHVLTTAHDIGGHTRLTERWIRLDTERRHDVVLLRQEGARPPALEETARASGGELIDLTAVRPGVVAQSRILRHVSATSDLVVLNVHPYDVVPSVAFADPVGRPPTLFVNAAGRSFAVGLGVADRVGWLRPAIRDLAVTRRGVPATRLTRVPVPLLDIPLPAKDPARASLGVAADDCVILTVARAFKLSEYGTVAPARTLTALVGAVPRAVVLVVGPPDADGWAETRVASGGRVRAVGPRVDLSDCYAAADVYLDSFPLSSETAVREAALAGLPVVSYAPVAGAAAAAVDLPGPADSLLVRAQDAAGLADAVRGLVESSERRQARGAALRDAVRRDGCNPGFLDGVAAAYATTLAASPMTPDELEDVAPTDAAIDQLLRVVNPMNVRDASAAEVLRWSEATQLGEPGGRLQPAYTVTDDATDVEAIGALTRELDALVMRLERS
jgi:hypothetical protein